MIITSQSFLLAIKVFLETEISFYGLEDQFRFRNWWNFLSIQMTRFIFVVWSLGVTFDVVEFIDKE